MKIREVEVDTDTREKVSDAIMVTINLIQIHGLEEDPFGRQIVSFLGVIGAAVVYENADPLNQLYMMFREFVQSPVGQQLAGAGQLKIIADPLEDDAE